MRQDQEGDPIHTLKNEIVNLLIILMCLYQLLLQTVSTTVMKLSSLLKGDLEHSVFIGLDPDVKPFTAVEAGCYDKI